MWQWHTRTWFDGKVMNYDAHIGVGWYIMFFGGFILLAAADIINNKK